MRLFRILILSSAFFIIDGLLAEPAGWGSPTDVQAASPSVPILAHYYIWFDPSSWNRAKQDLPSIGRYSSDDTAVMRQHIQWAKMSGIDGFIVSWKRTNVLDRRLEKLISIAEEENFKLAITYQGLNFSRDALPLETVAWDLDYFIERYADSPAFRIFQKPVVIWNGTSKFSRDEIASVTAKRRGSLFILSSEKDPLEYQRLSDLVDGNLYYWSSADPMRDSGYQRKLVNFGRVVHSDGGIWIAPSAPGFDARMVGGRRVIDRKGGTTLRLSLNAARESSPDAIGLISWNEFSENTHIEPSRRNGSFYLRIVAADEREPPEPTDVVDSSGQGPGGQPYGIVGLISGGALIIVCLGILLRRARTAG